MKLPGRRVRLLLFCAFAIGLLGLELYWLAARSHIAVAIDYRDADTVALGKVLYARQCASCHGANLEGEPNWRKKKADGRFPAPPHDGTGHTWHHSDQQLYELTKYGPAALVGGEYESDMQGYADVLEDREILAVLAFIKSTWPREIRERHNQINQRARMRSSGGAS